MIKITNKGKKAWVTFTLPADGVESATLSGTWNDWKSEPMKRKKSGDFYLTKVLATGNSYEFGYTINEKDWICDYTLGCIASPYGSDNSLLEI